MLVVKGLTIRKPLEIGVSLYLPKVRLTPTSPSRTIVQLLAKTATKRKKIKDIVSMEMEFNIFLFIF